MWIHCYPIDVEVTNKANERIRIGLKLYFNYESSGLVEIPDDDIFNQNSRRKFPRFLQHMRDKNNDPILKNAENIRFRDIKDLDLSHLLEPDVNGQITGIKEMADPSSSRSRIERN